MVSSEEGNGFPEFFSILVAWEEFCSEVYGVQESGKFLDLDFWAYFGFRV